MPNFGDDIKLDESTRIQVGDMFNRVQKGNWYWGGTSGGSANAHTVTVEGGPTSFVDGEIVAFIPGYTNTSNATLSVNATTARAMCRQNFSSLIAGDLIATNSIVLFMWAASNSSWILISDPSKFTQTYTPTYGGNASMSFSVSPTTNHAGYSLFGDRCIGTIQCSAGTLTGTPSDRWSITLPPVLSAAHNFDGGACAIRSNSGYEIGRWFMESGAIKIARPGFSNYATGANVECTLNFNYQATW